MVPADPDAAVNPSVSKEILETNGLRVYFDELESKIGREFHSAVIHANYQNGIVASDRHEPPNGTMILVNADSRLEPSLVSSKLGSAIYAVKIPREQIDAPGALQRIEQGLKAFNEATPERVEQHLERSLSHGPNASTRGKDARVWEPSLGGGGNFADVVLHEGDHAGSGDYWIRLRTDGGQAGKDLKRIAAEMLRRDPENTTFKSFAKSDEYARTMDLARRNAMRLMHNVCESIGVKLDYVYDSKAALSGPHDIPPKMLRNVDVHNPLNYIELLEVPNQRNYGPDKPNCQAIIGTQVTWIPMAKGALHYSSDATRKSYFYDIPEKMEHLEYDPSSNRQKLVSSRITRLGSYDNSQTFNTFAPFTGKVQTPAAATDADAAASGASSASSAPSIIASSISPSSSSSATSISSPFISTKLPHDVLSDISKKVAWEGEKELNPRATGLYKPITAKNHTINSEILGVKGNRYELRPVISKIASI